MKVTKFGHACLLVEKEGVSILLDPGSWNVFPNVHALDGILITHEHQDHCNTEQIKLLLAKHPSVKIFTHQAVGKILSDAGIVYDELPSGTMIDIKGLTVESIGTDHAAIYGDVSPCRNAGYIIGSELLVPGDALHDVPTKPIRVLALPTGGPWMKLSEAIDYAKMIKPEIAFPIHDAMYTDVYRDELVPRIVGSNLEGSGIQFVNIAVGATEEI